MQATSNRMREDRKSGKSGEGKICAEGKEGSGRETNDPVSWLRGSHKEPANLFIIAPRK